MVMGKKSEKDLEVLAETKKKLRKPKKEVIEEPIEEVIEDVEINQEIDDNESESFKKVLGEFKEDGGWVHIKKKVDGKIVKIGKYRPNDFDKDEIAKEYGGGTYYYVLRDNDGRIRARNEETYITKAEPEKNQNNDMLQMATIIKEQTKEIETLKAMINQPKPEDTSKRDLLYDIMKQNQEAQMNILKVIAESKNQQQPQTSMTEMLTAITTIMSLINKQQPQVQPEQPKNNISDLVELASLFADMKNSGEPPKQETMMDIVKTFLTDGSLANVIAMLKAPKPPLIQKPQNQQVQQPKQIQNTQPEQQQQITNEQEKQVVQEFFKQYEKQLYQLKVDGQNSEYIANTIFPVFDLNKDFKMIGYNYFKDIETAYNGLLEVSTDFKNEPQTLKEVVEIIHNYFHNPVVEEDVINEQEN